MNNKRLYHSGSLGESFVVLLWLAFFAIFVIASYGFLFGNSNFTLPKEAPVTQSTAAYGSIKYYYITYNEDFRGFALHTGGYVTFYIENHSKKSVNFKNAKFWLWSIDKEGYSLELRGVNNINFEKESYALTPKGSIEFSCEVPLVRPEQNEIKGFNITGATGKPIRFGYHRLSLWDKGRWWLAEQLR